MLQYQNCPNCFAPLSGTTVCPHCGNDYAKNKQYAGALPPFSLLNNRYLTGRVLGRGGFGITYIAKDIISNNMCAIKEYMPTIYCSRSGGSNLVVPPSDNQLKRYFINGRDKFVEEAKSLLRLRNNPFVVDILDYFTQNNTAYLVMEYLDGQDLRKMARSNGGKLEPDFAKTVFVTVASALMEIHRMNILHRDLSPENIIVTSDGRIKLIDFGAARNYVNSQNKGMTVLLKPGFGPPEQHYKNGAIQGPWCDVYALCATFYTLVSGKTLVDRSQVSCGEKEPSLASLGCQVSKRTSDVIERGMELDYKRRYQNFKELLDDIDIQTREAPRKVPQKEPNKVPNKVPSNILKTPEKQVSQPFVAAIVGKSICNKVLVGSKDIFKIGRSAQSCQYIVSGDTNISRIHCYIRCDRGKIYLCDASANGTFFSNGARLEKNKEYAITPGTQFYLATKNHMLILGL